MKQTVAKSSRVADQLVRLLMALDLGLERWTLAFLGGTLQKPRQVQIPAGDIKRLQKEVESARVRAGLPVGVEVCSCYEAGREAFSVHRQLTALGYANLVVDSSSIERGRRSKEKKTDRIDATKLVEMLWRHYYQPMGRRPWSVVRIPTREEEDLRRQEREQKRLVNDRTRTTNRIGSLLAADGIYGVKPRQLQKRLDQLQAADGTPLLPHTKEALQQLLAELELIDRRLKELASARREQLKQAAARATQRQRSAPVSRVQDVEGAAAEKAMRMMMFRGIGPAAWTIALEFGWREFRNTREVGAAAGLTGCLWSSGKMSREQGVGRSGDPRVRQAMVQLGWCWLRYQPQSALAQWWQKRFSHTKRERKIGIIALARKLLIALWKFWMTGEVIEGAVLKTAAA